MLQILAVVVAMGRPVSEVCRRFEPVPQHLTNVRYKDGQPLEDGGVQKAIDAAKGRLGDWGVW
jgi:phosphoglucosamine mutase